MTVTYDFILAPSLADIRLILTSKENEIGLGTGTIACLTMGIHLEDIQSVCFIYLPCSLISCFCRDALRHDVKRMKKCPTTSEKISIEERRQKLRARLRSFHNKVYDIMMKDSVDELDFARRRHGDMGSDDDQTSDEDDSGSDSSDDQPDSDDGESGLETAENTVICMPSSLIPEHMQRPELEVLCQQEIELRVGQANSRLHDLRVALGHKALVFRMKVRKANTSKGKTRSWDEIKMANVQVTKVVRAYRRAHLALRKLGADPVVLDRFQEITPEDLQLNKDVTEENRYGQRQDVLPWFWRMGSDEEQNHDEWLTECEFTYELCFPRTDFYLFVILCEVYRVSWLRAKARHDRWDEENILVKNEMQWTVLGFQNLCNEWKRRAKESQNHPGRLAYAEKQVAMWQLFCEECSAAFNGLMEEDIEDQESGDEGLEMEGSSE